MTYYLPGDPAHTEYVKQLELIKNVADRRPRFQKDGTWISHIYVVTASHYGRIIEELRAQSDAPKFEVPGYLLVGTEPCLAVINSGTDDQGEVNKRNREWAEMVSYQDRLGRLARNPANA